jgi:hypothetical protein
MLTVADVVSRASFRRETSGGLLEALGNLRDSRAAAAGRPPDCSPGLPYREHSADAVIAFGILRAALIATFGFCLGLTFACRRRRSS